MPYQLGDGEAVAAEIVLLSSALLPGAVARGEEAGGTRSRRDSPRAKAADLLRRRAKHPLCRAACLYNLAQYGLMAEPQTWAVRVPTPLPSSPQVPTGLEMPAGKDAKMSFSKIDAASSTRRARGRRRDGTCSHLFLYHRRPVEEGALGVGLW